jgi:release factor glutamine methyltransferase
MENRELPAGYSVGFVDFLGCKIDLSFRPFIPEFETEYWVEKAIEDIKKLKRNVRCLDVFAGSGCIGIAVLKNVPNAKMDFAEKNPKFAKQIRKNLKINKIAKSRARVFVSDIFSKISGKYDFILANPPYIPIKNKDMVQESVLKNEPKEALFGGQDGLFFIKKFLKEAKKKIKPGGLIYMEFDSLQKKELEKILRKLEYNNFEFKKDQYNRWRYLEIISNF